MQLGRIGCETAPGENAEWTFVIGRGFLAVVPVGTGTPVVSALHALAAKPRVAIESLVALLPLGAEDVDAFALIVPGERQGTDAPGTAVPPHDGIPVHAVVRGAVAVDVFSIGGSRRFTDRNIRPWLVAEFQSVTGLVIGSPLATAPGAHRLGAGRALGAGVDSGDTLYWSVRTPDADDAVLRPRRTLDHTATRGSRAPETVAPAGIAPLAHPAGPVDRTGGAPLDEETPKPVRAPGHYGFRLATGDVRRLDRVYRIGRDPRPRRTPGGEPLELLAVASPRAIVSANHLEIRQDGDAVVLTDLGATNGTLVRFALGRTQRLRFGASLTVVPGTTVDIGDGNLIEILPAG